MAWYVCIDIGGTSVKHSVMNEMGKIAMAGSTPNCIAAKGIDAFLQSILTIVTDSQKEYKIAGAALCSAGIINTETGCIVRAPRYFPDYAGVNIPKYIEEKLSIPATIINDVNAMCLGEYWLGAGQKAKSLFCVAFGTGIGGALMLDGKLWEGASYSAGEVGLMQAGEPDNWEDLASTAGLIRAVAKAKGCEPAELDGNKIFALAQNQDQDAIKAIEKMVARWAQGLANICYTVNPQVIVLGGGIMAQQSYLLPKIRTDLESLLLDPVYDATTITCAKLGNGAGMVGALYYFLQLNPPEA